MCTCSTYRYTKRAIATIPTQQILSSRTANDDNR